MAAARFIRFFSRRQPKPSSLNGIETKHIKLTSNGSKPAVVQQQQQSIPIKNGLVCTVVFLDGDDVNFEVDRKALGKNLYDKVITHTKLVESDYFSLQFTDTHNVKHWLDPTKSIKKQCKIGPPYTFRFRVKFYTSEPQNLHDELTRYLFVLQLKDDIRTGKLECPPGSDVELAALAMQAELGDYTSDEHTIETISEFRFLPDDRQTEEFEEHVLQKWATHQGLTPADCEVQYLNKARWLEMYGVDLHTVMGKDGLEYKLGLTPTGILVFENKVKIGLFVWSKVTRIEFNRNKLTIVVVEDDDNDPTLQRDFVFLFRCYDEKQCKHFWKCAMEYHVFFRTTSAAKIKQPTRSNFARTGSRFRFSGRTECQAATLANFTRRSANFERKASQRFSRRASYAIRKKIQEQEALREQEDERLRKLKSEQEAKLDETKKSPEHKRQTNTSLSNHDLTSIGKRPPSLTLSQKNLSLSATQRLDNLIQGDVPQSTLIEDSESRRSSTSVPRPPPIPPRQGKSDEKSSLIVKQQSNTNYVLDNSTTKESPSVESNHNGHHVNDDSDQTLLIQMSPQKPMPTVTTNGHNQSPPSASTKVNSPPHRYTLSNSQSTTPSSVMPPYVVKETFFYSESLSPATTINNNNNTSSINRVTIHNNNLPSYSLSTSTAPVIVTRTLSTSNVRNASATIVQSTVASSSPTTSLLQPPPPSSSSSSSSSHMPLLYPRTSTRSPSASIIMGSGTHSQSYHPITTEL